MTGRSEIVYYAEHVGAVADGRGVLRCDVVVDGQLVPELSGIVGSPAPIETVRQHEHRHALVSGTRRLCRSCGVPVVDAQRRPYTVADDVDGDGVCQWCRQP